MAGRGRWRGQSNSNILDDAMDRTETQRSTKSQIEDSVKPKDKYPPLRLPPLPPLPLPKEGDEEYHKLLVFQNYIDSFKQSMFYTRLPEKTDGIERYSDMFNTRTENKLKLDWELMPKDLWPADFKKKWLKKNKVPSTSTKRKRNEMENGEDNEWVSKKISVKTEGDDDGEDEMVEEEEEVEEEEMEEDEQDDDYNQIYFDDDDDYPGDNDDEDTENRSYF